MHEKMEGCLKEQEAIQCLKHGDINGLKALVERYQSKAIRTAYLITRDIGLAEDIVQDSFLRAYKSIHGFDGNRPFEPWFLRSVTNASVKAMQKAERQIQFGVDVEEEAFIQLVLHSESVESQAETVETHQQVWDAMQKLSPRQRAVIVQRYFLEMTEKDMSTELNIAPGTIKWLLNAARERLRALIADRSDK